MRMKVAIDPHAKVAINSHLIVATISQRFCRRLRFEEFIY